MEIKAQQLSGEHIGKTVTIEDSYTSETVTSPLVEVLHNLVTVKLRFRNRIDAVYPNTPITIQEGQ